MVVVVDVSVAAAAAAVGVVVRMMRGKLKNNDRCACRGRLGGSYCRCCGGGGVVWEVWEGHLRYAFC